MKILTAMLLASLMIVAFNQQLLTLSVDVEPKLEAAQYEYYVVDLSTREVFALLKTQVSQASFKLPPGSYVVFVKVVRPEVKPMSSFIQVELTESKQVKVDLTIPTFLAYTPAAKEEVSIPAPSELTIKVFYSNGSPAEDAVITIKSLVDAHEETIVVGEEGVAKVPRQMTPMFVIASKQNLLSSQKLVMPGDEVVTLTLGEVGQAELLTSEVIHEFGLRTYSPTYLAIKTGSLIAIAAVAALFVGLLLRRHH
ncbi:MAG: hypothetical protein DRJ31_00345 [Candidatus Methanomethylicota archaeon]|uniref:Uncharacterized protein n=1 Tax=Thermoproteota archaeon TaxID=2056631 RepID=A0A497EU10_9CREN|nr:MAG: hypothetical protein DRJ31_00345 [Candidatus Verstraetearchaeota archaeon]